MPARVARDQRRHRTGAHNRRRSAVPTPFSQARGAATDHTVAASGPSVLR